MELITTKTSWARIIIQMLAHIVRHPHKIDWEREPLSNRRIAQ